MEANNYQAIQHELAHESSFRLLNESNQRIKALEAIITRFGGCFCDECIDLELETIAFAETED